jgi:hypothetical protein
MSLAEPTLWERAIANKRWIIYAVLALVLIGTGLFIWQSVDTYIFNRGVKKDKAAIANKINEIANVTANINAMQANRAEKVGELRELTNVYVDASNADAQAKAEANRALSNLATVVNSNSNVNASADDLQKKLDKLGVQ